MMRMSMNLFGAAALCWAIFALVSLRASYPFEGLAQQIIAGETFEDEALKRNSESISSLASDGMVSLARMRSAVILNARVVELNLDRANMSDIDSSIGALYSITRASLRTGPADPFSWLVLYWLSNIRNGSVTDNLAYLEMSSRLGPREGWISARRSRLTLAMFKQLSSTMQDAAVDEFSAMVNSSMTAEAADNLLGVGWPIRVRLVASLAEIDASAREAFSTFLYKMGIDLVIPGVPDRKERPWR